MGLQFNCHDPALGGRFLRGVCEEECGPAILTGDRSRRSIFNGVEKIIEITLTADEQAAFNKSAGAVKELVDVIGV